jgi:PKHD-type hydroxylase
MLISVPDVLTDDHLSDVRKRLGAADWQDGRITAGHQSRQVKDNQQLGEDHPLAHELGRLILSRLERNPIFLSAALPLKVFPPLFNRYSGGQAFGTHVDNAIRTIPGSALRVRTDLSATLFLSDPESYDGGDLVVEGSFGLQSVKLPAGHMLLYPASSLHHVKAVTRGERLASFFWIQSMVRDDAMRTILFDLDLAVQRLNRDNVGQDSALSLTGVYHNLLRRYAET